MPMKEYTRKQVTTCASYILRCLSTKAPIVQRPDLNLNPSHFRKAYCALKQVRLIELGIPRKIQAGETIWRLTEKGSRYIAQYGYDNFQLDTAKNPR